MANKNIYILAFTLFVVMLGFGLVIPLMPFYVERLGAGGSELGLLIACYAIMRLVFGPFWGSLSDRVGRKPVLMVGIFGYGITMLLFGLANQLWMLFVFRSLSGILSSAATPATMAYVSDSTGEKERGGGMGMLGAALGLGTILGPGLGGLLAKNWLALPFFVASGMSLIALLLIAALLPESLPESARRPRGVARKVSRPRLMLQALNSPIGVLLGMTFLVSYATTSFSGIFGLYAAQRYQFGPEQVGGMLMVVGVVMVVAQGVFAGSLTRRWGEPWVIRISLLGAGLGFVAMALSASAAALLFSTGFFALALALLIPSVTALISKRSSLEHGLAMGLNNSFESLGRIFGPLAGGFLFDLSRDLTYLSGAAVMLLGFFLAMARITYQQQAVEAR